MFALWALIRWGLLIAFGIMNKENQPMRWAIAWLWLLLFILAIVIIADRNDAKTIAWICIWISTILDGISLLAFALKVKNNPSLQAELVNQADQNEIAQWNIIITETTVTIQKDSQSNNETQQ